MTARFAAAIDCESKAAAHAVRVRRVAFTAPSDRPPVACDADLQASLRAAARELGLAQTDLPSNPGHDAAFMSRILPPSHGVRAVPRGKMATRRKNGRTGMRFAGGAAVILRAVKTLDRSLRGDLRRTAMLRQLPPQGVDEPALRLA